MSNFDTLTQVQYMYSVSLYSGKSRLEQRELLLFLRLLTHVKVSVRCLFKDDQFGLLVWLLLYLLLLCFHIQKQLILHALAITHQC